MKKLASILLAALVILLLFLAAIPGNVKPNPGPSGSPSTKPSAVPSSSPSKLYPTLKTAGAPSGINLAQHSGDLVLRAANSVIENKLITGDVDVRADNATIRNSVVLGRVFNDSTENHFSFTLENVTVGPESSCSAWSAGAIGTKNYTANNVLVRGFVDGMRIAGSNVTIENSYIDLCGDNPESHSDGIQAYGAADGKNVVIRGNVIDQTKVIDEAQTSPIFIPVGPGQGNDNLQVVIQDNVLAGGGFSLRVEAEALSISGNKIVDGTWGYQPVDVVCSRVTDWSDNSVITYDFASGKVLSEVRQLSC